jgi:uroporphyrinogen decarboxylase
VRALRIVEPEEATPDLFDAIRLIRRDLDGRTAVLGFAGAPFTVASYLIEGHPTKDFARSKALMYGQPALWHELMETLTEVTIRYLRAQVRAGVQALQLFDSWVGALGAREYSEYVLPYVRRIFSGVAGTVPTIHFATSTAHMLEAMAGAGSSAVSVDWRLPLDRAWSRIGDLAIQGNLDPTICLAPWDIVEREAGRVLAEAGGRPGHIFNLGHGVLADTPSDTLRRLVDLVHERTAVAV